MATKADEIRRRILDLAVEYVDAAFADRPFVPGETPVPAAGKVFDADEVRSLLDASLDFWLTTGRFADRLEADLAKFVGAAHAMLVNSGSSANLVALSCLTSPSLGDRRLVPGDEVITVASAFPTTVNPIFQNGLVPVFVDVSVPTYNVDASRLEAARSPRTRAIILAHMLGNPFDLDAVTAFAKQHDLWLVEDCCDALGARWRGKTVGTFGDLSTFSFYPAHHMTTGEGGAVMTSSGELRKLALSFRDWGRDCWCETGRDDTCRKRYGWKLGDLPFGYDHKYTYSHVGYNLKLTDMQAAVGVAQMGKLSAFAEARRRNYERMRKGLADLEAFFVLPEATPGAEACWFGFPLGVRDGAPFTREELLKRLNARKIGTRLLFGGNLVRQPCYQGLNYRVAGTLDNSDWVMNRVFWTGVYPGLTDAMIDFTLETFHDFCRGR